VPLHHSGEMGGGSGSSFQHQPQADETHQPLRRDPRRRHLGAIDFETQNLADVLADHGYRPERPTFFVWEAVTQYLTEAGVRKAFDFLAAAAPGSRLVFTYVRKDFLDGTALYGGESAYQEFVLKRQQWHFGMDPTTLSLSGLAG
jgi:methyltransferase (TIGR00027 family)